MDWTLEVVVLPVSDIDRSVAFYRDQVGFDLDHDTTNEHMHAVQLTPRGSGCSIVFGDLLSQREMAPGSMKGLQLCVADAAAARPELLSRGVEASELQSFADQDGGTFFGFSDPDGNTWAVQELKVRGEKPLIPHEARGRFGVQPDGAQARWCAVQHTPPRRRRPRQRRVRDGKLVQGPYDQPTLRPRPTGLDLQVLTIAPARPGLWPR